VCGKLKDKPRSLDIREIACGYDVINSSQRDVDVCVCVKFRVCSCHSSVGIGDSVVFMGERIDSEIVGVKRAGRDVSFNPSDCRTNLS